MHHRGAVAAAIDLLQKLGVIQDIHLGGKHQRLAQGTGIWDDRPGVRQAEEVGVAVPLAEAGAITVAGEEGRAGHGE